uniref:Uncharacterized protein n=1 Tax=Glossina pallidipes TaxID=7398 RepID=A0A1B0AF01_GLOPL
MISIDFNYVFKNISAKPINKRKHLFKVICKEERKNKPMKCRKLKQMEQITLRGSNFVKGLKVLSRQKYHFIYITILGFLVLHLILRASLRLNLLLFATCSLASVKQTTQSRYCNAPSANSDSLI